MSSAVLDASAVLALLNGEPGAVRVAAAVQAGAIVSAVNFSEVAAKLLEANMPQGAVEESIRILDLSIASFGTEMAFRAAALREPTRRQGLSLGDRACLALAQAEGVPVLTTDRAWADLALGVVVEVVR